MTAPLPFAKWNGLGNDYILVHEHDIPTTGPDGRPRLTDEAVRALCNRNFGVGSDGILVLGPSQVAAARMSIHNPDASMAEMCGNGVRMAARFLVNAGVVPATGPFALETDGGIVHPEVLLDGRVCVDMGIANVTAPEHVLTPTGDGYEGRAISIGNPHFVVRLDPSGLDLATIGPQLELHDRFPNRTNVEFYRIDASDRVTMRVWERGVGETLACGSGACAVGVAAVLDANCTNPVTVVLLGGELQIAVEDDLRVHMTGAAVESFSGTVHDLDKLQLPAALITRQEALI